MYHYHCTVSILTCENICFKKQRKERTSQSFQFIKRQLHLYVIRWPLLMLCILKHCCSHIMTSDFVTKCFNSILQNLIVESSLRVLRILTTTELYLQLVWFFKKKPWISIIMRFLTVNNVRLKQIFEKNLKCTANIQSNEF